MMNRVKTKATLLKPLSRPNINRHFQQRVTKTFKTSDPKWTDFAKQVEIWCLDALDDSCNEDKVIAISVIMDCISFHENTGNVGQARRSAERLIDFADEVDDVNTKRRLHNVLGVLNLRMCDFSKACKHMEAAYNLALQIDDPYYINAISANLVAILLSMGLLEDARDLAFRVAEQPCISPKFVALQLPNASNGLDACHLLEDIESAEKFYRMGLKLLTGSKNNVAEVSRVNFEALSAYHLTLTGQSERALANINASIARVGQTASVRVRSSLYVAQARVLLSLGDEERLSYCIKQLVSLIPETHELPDKHEEILRTLVKIHVERTVCSEDIDKKYARHYLKLLHEHAIAVKHRYFFFDQSTDFSSSDKITLENPSYRLPDWISDLGEPISSSVRAKRQTVKESDSVVPFDFLQQSYRSNSATVEPTQFDIAENWAVAAEFAEGGDGRHCFRVGKLAAAISLELGFSHEASNELDRACRLHDIGKVVVSFSRADAGSLRALGGFSLASEHAHAGAHLLEESSDSVLQRAARVAKTHHEWWNGCGYPFGLKGMEIPLDGRICFLAETFLEMVAPSDRKGVWVLDKALMQIQSMAGIQIDPELIGPFLRVASLKELDWTALSDSVDPSLNKNQFVIAKRQLFETLELA